MSAPRADIHRFRRHSRATQFCAVVVFLVTPALVSAHPTTPSACDLNGDGSSNVVDVQLEINQALGVAASANDLNRDGSVNLADVQLVLNAALSLGCAPDGVTTPVITDFSPKSGPAGTLVTISGSNLLLAAGSTQVSLSQQGGGSIAAPISSAFPTVLTFVIPSGAATGPVTVTAGAATAMSSATLTIVPASTFTLSALPGSANLIQGQSASFAITLSSANGFAQLADLSFTGLPTGVSASLVPAQITTGQTAVLTLSAPSGQPTVSSALTLTAAATVNGLPVSSSANVTLNVTPITTSLIGRTVVADALETPLAGVTVSMLGKDGDGNATNCGNSAVSDSAGNFALTNLPAGCVGPQLVAFNGLTATSPAGKYAGVNLVFTITAGQITASPVLVHLPRIDNQETFNVQQNSSASQSYSFSSIPGLSVVVYAGTTFTMPDGTRPNPFPLTAVQVPVDRLPDNKPNVPTMIRDFIVAFQPANANTNEPVAVFYPNSLNTPPGTDMALMTLDPTRGTMVPYGTGQVSADGTQIVPDPDPSHPGHLYGLIHFDWHGPMPPPPDDYTNSCGSGCDDPPSPGGATQPPDGDDDDPPGDGQTPNCGDPVDPSTGLEVLTNTDIGVFGPRGSIYVLRTYRSQLATPGPFGIGTQHNFGYFLSPAIIGTNMINLIMPDNTRIPFTPLGNGVYVNTTVPNFSGATIAAGQNGQIVLRRRDGRQFMFTVEGPLVAHLSAEMDRFGNTITLNRNPAVPAQLLEIVDPVGRKLTLTYDSSNRIVSITDPVGRQVTYTYDTLGRLATYTNAEGGVTSYQYDPGHRLTQVTDPRGVVIAKLAYDANGRVSQQTLADGSQLKFQYTLVNPLVATSPVQQTTITDGLGHKFSYRFNEYGFLIQFTDAAGQSRIFTRETYLGQTTSSTVNPGSAAGAKPKLEMIAPKFPGSNRLISVSGPAACSTCGDAGSGDYQFTYDGNGNLLTKTDSAGNVTTFSYEPVFNRVTSIQNGLGQTVQYLYDSLGNLTSVTDANGRGTAFTYNSFGQVTQVTDAAGQSTNFTYDALGNLSSSTDPLGKAQSFLYDGVARLVQSRDALGRRSAFSYDRLNRTVSTRDGNGQTTTFSYDPVGNVLQVTDARNATTTFTYDPLSRVKTRTGPLGKTAAWTYDLNGNITQSVDRRGQVSTFTYDALNRLTKETYQDRSSVARHYDARGRLDHVDDSSGGLFDFTYDATGGLRSATTPSGMVQYTRDILRRVHTRQAAGAQVVTYTYDHVGNLLAANSTDASSSFTYDPRNLLATQSRTNGVTSTYDYDAVGRVLSIVHQGSTLINSQVMTYDAMGNRLGTQSNLAQALITAGTASSFDSENRLLQRGTSAYTYDDNGNRLTETNPSGTTTYTWDSRNRLASITTPQGQTINFTYDFRGLMIGKSAPGDSELYLLDDRTNVIWQSVNGQASSILSGRGIDQPIAVITSGVPSFGLTDAVNSTVAVTNAGGSQTASLSYEPFGQASSQNVSYPFQFTGRTNSGVPGLYYYRARFYDSVGGQFVSQDPVELSSGGHDYSYADNNPLSWNDPTGLFPSYSLLNCGRLPGSIDLVAICRNDTELCELELTCAAKDLVNQCREHPVQTLKDTVHHVCEIPGIGGILCDVVDTPPMIIDNWLKLGCWLHPENQACKGGAN